MMPRLAERQILIVEDEILIADFVGMLVEDEGGVVIGPAASVVQALRYLETERVDAAVLDVNLRDGEVTPLAGTLRQRQIPFVLHTGGILHSRLRLAIGDAPVIYKPAHSGDIISALETLTSSPHDGPRPCRANGHALVIEDDEHVARIVEAYLLRAGFGSVDRVATQTAAIMSSERRRPEMMVVDIRLEEGDGLTAAAIIRSRLGAIPALFMTAYPELLGEAAGPRCLKKPFTSLSIETAIRATCVGV